MYISNLLRNGSADHLRTEEIPFQTAASRLPVSFPGFLKNGTGNGILQNPSADMVFQKNGKIHYQLQHRQVQTILLLQLKKSLNMISLRPVRKRS